MADPTSTSSAVIAKRIPSKQAFAKWAVVATVANAAVDVTAADLSSLRSLIMLVVRVVLMAALGTVLGDRREQTLSLSPSTATTKSASSSTTPVAPARVEFTSSHVGSAPVSPLPAPSKPSPPAPPAPSNGHARTDSGIDMSEPDTTVATDVPPRASAPARTTPAASLPRTTSLPRAHRTSWPRTTPARPISTATALIAPVSPCPSLHPSVAVEVVVTPPAVPAVTVRWRGPTRKWATLLRPQVVEKVNAPVPAWRQWVAQWRGKVGRVLQRRPSGVGVGIKRKRAGSRVGGMQSRRCGIKGKAGMKGLGNAARGSWMPASMTAGRSGPVGRRGLVSRMRRERDT